MTIIDKYRRKTYPSGDSRWTSLVQCESSLHIGNALRVVARDKLKFQGIGEKRCDICAHHENSGEKHYLFGKHPSLKTRIKLSVAHQDPGISSEERDRMRTSNCGQGVIWKNLIFRRDNWTCQITGIRGDSLQVHHLYNWSAYTDKRFDIHNGITLRKDIHLLFHQIYGTKNNNPLQFFEFCEYMYDVLRM